MGRSATYKSPSTKIRNLRRLVSYLKQKLPSIKKKVSIPLSLSEIPYVALPYTTLVANPKYPNLTSSTSFTNFPEPCSVCQENECSYNMSHQLSFSICGAMDKAFAEAFNTKKPPDELSLPPS